MSHLGLQKSLVGPEAVLILFYPCPTDLSVHSSNISLFEKNPSLKLKDFFLENMGKNRAEYVAIDCEMVATVEDINALARVSVVNENCNVLLDEFVVPESRIRDYRTRYSGITPQILKERGKGWLDLSIFTYLLSYFFRFRRYQGQAQKLDP